MTSTCEDSGGGPAVPRGPVGRNVAPNSLFFILYADNVAFFRKRCAECPQCSVLSVGWPVGLLLNQNQRTPSCSQLMYDQRPDEELQKKMIPRKPCTTIVEVVPQVSWPAWKAVGGGTHRHCAWNGVWGAPVHDARFIGTSIHIVSSGGRNDPRLPPWVLEGVRRPVRESGHMCPLLRRGPWHCAATDP